MIIVAHRGNNKEAFENSISAFKKSVECGADRIELDVLLSKDGHLVINHDDHLFHSTGHDVYCSQLNRHDIQSISLKNGEKIPFLDEVISNFLGQIELNIEIKGNSAVSARSVADMISTNPLKEKIIISSFHPEPLLYFKNHHPEIQTACLTGDDTLPWPFFSHLSVLNFMQMTGSKIVHPRMDQISESFMDQCKNRGWKVVTWSPMVGEDFGREASWVMLETLGVDGHCTNYPRELIEWRKQQLNYNSRLSNFVLPHTKGDARANSNDARQY